MSEIRVLAAAALLAGGVAAAVSVVTVRYMADRVSHVASVRLGELAAGYAARAARGDASAVETAAAAQIWALDLEAALERVAARHGVALLPAHAVAGGAADLTAAVEAELAAVAATHSTIRSMDGGGVEPEVHP